MPLEFIRVGKPATEIVKAAKDRPADLIVVGSHARGGVGRLLLGSVGRGRDAPRRMSGSDRSRRRVSPHDKLPGRSNRSAPAQVLGCYRDTHGESAIDHRCAALAGILFWLNKIDKRKLKKRRL
jgi:universal stress protein family protein